MCEIFFSSGPVAAKGKAVKDFLPVTIVSQPGRFHHCTLCQSKDSCGETEELASDLPPH
jgi:hypothetical protein